MARPSIMHLVENRPAHSPVWLNLREILQISTSGALSGPEHVVFYEPSGAGTSTDPFPSAVEALAYIQRVIGLIDTVT